MPSPLPSPRPSPAHNHTPSRVLAKAGETAGHAGAGREACPYGDGDARSVPWLDGWWQGQIERKRATARRARDAMRREGLETGETEPLPGRCRLPGCTKPIRQDPTRSKRQNALSKYCCPQHKAVACHRLRVEKARKAAVLAAREERRGRQAVTKKKEPQPHPDVVGPCRVCGAPVTWDESKSAHQNLNAHYCGEEHKLEWRRRVRAGRAARERAEVAAGTRKARRGGLDKSVPDRCEEQAARLGAYWLALGYDVRPRIEVMPLDNGEPPTAHGARSVRRVVSDLVGGKPPGVPWDEVQQRMRARDRRLMGQTPG